MPRQIYLTRHQHGGTLAWCAFDDEPTDEQLEAVSKSADAVYGDGWISSFPVPVFRNSERPVADKATEQIDAIDTGNTAEQPRIVGNGIGTVSEG